MLNSLNNKIEINRYKSISKNGLSNCIVQAFLITFIIDLRNSSCPSMIITIIRNQTPIATSMVEKTSNIFITPYLFNILLLTSHLIFYSELMFSLYFIFVLFPTYINRNFS